VEINRKKFIEKWADELSLQDASPWAGRVPVTACRERLLRKDLTQEDVIYCLNGEKTARRARHSSLPIDKSVVYRTIAEKEKKAADVVMSAVSRYGAEKVGVGWSGGKDSAALVHLIRQACGGVIPFRVVSLLTGEDPPEEHRFIEGLSREWGFDLLTPDAGPSAEVPKGHDSHLNPSLDVLFRTAVQRLHLKAVITGRRGDRPEPEPPSVFFYHEDNPRHVRVQPMVHFREVDVWQYIKRHDVPLCEIIHGGDRDPLFEVSNAGGSHEVQDGQ
jgi:3'-phosphoadenosine 5'-phosphosulfate sulfotransferase (PAPS reductase)/FAD synthetase